MLQIHIKPDNSYSSTKQFSSELVLDSEDWFDVPDVVLPVPVRRSSRW